MRSDEEQVVVTVSGERLDFAASPGIRRVRVANRPVTVLQGQPFSIFSQFEFVAFLIAGYLCDKYELRGVGANKILR